MKIFLSWSGPRAERIAHLVERALLSVYPGVRFFHSSEGVTAGETWRSVIGERLSECDFGIVFLTPDRPNAPWLQFEAGAIAKRLRFARVVPFLVGVHLRDVSSPLQAYEPTVIGIDPAKNKAQFLRLLESIAVSSPSPLKVKFSVFHDESWWSELDERLRQEAASFWHPDVYVLNEAPLRTYQDSYGLAMSMLARCRRTDLLSGGFYFHSNIPGFRDLLRSRACKPGISIPARRIAS